MQIELKLFRHPLFLQNIDSAIRQVLIEIEYELYRQNPKMANFSGTTLCMAVVRNSEITIANIGDSRIIIAQNDQNISYSTDTIGDIETFFSTQEHSLSAKSTSSQSSASTSTSRSSTTSEDHEESRKRSSSVSSKRSRSESFGEISEMTTQVTTLLDDKVRSTNNKSLTNPIAIDPLPPPSTIKKRKLKAQELTIDHKPHLPHELKRIQQAGGRVFAIKYDENTVGPPRVWLGNVNIPGLAMSRSLGDFVVHTAGVISTPEIFHYTIREGVDHMLIVGTDGIWDQFTSEEVISIASNYQHLHESVLAILEKSHTRWVTSGRGIDDTTIGIVKFHNSGSAFSSPIPSSKHRSPPCSFHAWQEHSPEILRLSMEPEIFPEASSTQSPTALSLPAPRDPSLLMTTSTVAFSTSTASTNTSVPYTSSTTQEKNTQDLYTVPTYSDPSFQTTNDVDTERIHIQVEENDEGANNSDEDTVEDEELLEEENSDEEDDTQGVEVDSYSAAALSTSTLTMFPIFGGGNNHQSYN